ncbi:MAG: hypothetical protein WCF99_02120, partial [Chloroflexales bacterium]
MVSRSSASCCRLGEDGFLPDLQVFRRDRLHRLRENYFDAARCDTWWGRAREAAALLCERFSAQRVVILGDLVRPEPLHFWSELTLVVSGLADDSYSNPTQVVSRPPTWTKAV